LLEVDQISRHSMPDYTRESHMRIHMHLPFLGQRVLTCLTWVKQRQKGQGCISHRQRHKSTRREITKRLLA
jgi:hypothetical protein